MLPKYFQHTLPAMLAFGLLVTTIGDAHAYCETATASGKPTCGRSAPPAGSSDNAAAAAAIGAGVGLLLQGLANSANDDDTADRQAEEYRRDIERHKAKQRQGALDAIAAEQAARGSSEANPWGKKQAPKKKTNDGSSTSNKKYVDASHCVTFNRPSGSQFDAVINSCNAPIVVRWLDSGGCKTGCQTGVPASGQASITRIKGAGSFTACQGKYCSPKRS